MELPASLCDRKLILHSVESVRFAGAAEEEAGVGPDSES